MVIITSSRLESSKIKDCGHCFKNPFPSIMKCPLCHSMAAFFLKDDGREYEHCSNCKLIFVPSQYFVSLDEEARRYLQHENSMENQGYINMFQEKIDIVKKICLEVKTVLDYGCGYEPVLKILLNREGYSAQGYDPNFFPDTNLKPEYDLIMSTETFEHFKEPGKEMTQLAPRLSAEGYLAVMTRFYPVDNGSPNQNSFKNWYYKRDLTHISFYCTETFSWMAGFFGFNILFNDKKDFIVMQKTSS